MNNRTPKYILISNYIINEIQKGVFRTDDKLPSESELMKMFSVSRIVVVNALNTLKKSGIIYRIAGKGSFVSKDTATETQDNRAHLLPELKSHCVHFLISGIVDSYSVNITHSLMVELSRRNINCYVAYTYNDKEVESKLVERAISSGIEGIILYPCDQELYSQALLKATEINYPVVVIDHDLPGLGLCCVSTDNESATRKAVSHLLELGHEKICLFSRVPMPTLSITDRVNGFINEMKSKNKLIDPSLILTNDSEDKLIEELNRVIRNKLSTAIICLSLFDYKIVVKAIKDNNLTCPRDFSVIHFDAIFDDFFVDKPSTHIDQDVTQIAFKTAELVDRMLTTGTHICEKLKIDPIFVEGNTTAPLKV